MSALAAPAAPPPQTLIPGGQAPTKALCRVRARCAGPALGKAPCLTSMVSASPAALLPLMAATRCSSRRPCSSLPVMSSHRADSASHLGGGGHCLWVPRAWPTQASLPPHPSAQRGGLAGVHRHETREVRPAGGQ